MAVQPTPNSLTASITDQPILVAPESERLFASLVQELASSEQFSELYEASLKAQDNDDYWDDSDPWVAAFRPYNVVNGVLQIPVYGVLLNKLSFQFGRRATGYQYIERAFNRGMADPNVNAIAFVIDSPGGEVAGNFELVEQIAARRGEKPIRAFANDHAYSAAYSIASAASQITMSRSGGVGSVGVVIAHVEMSEMLKDWGVKVTFIFAGKYKVDGNAYEKLSATAKNRMQDRVDRIYGEFTGLVAANRGMDEQAVRDTEALTYDATDAIEVGFADNVGAFEEELAAFAEEAETTETEFMTDKSKTTQAVSTATADGQSAITQEQLESAEATARAEGATGERDRINAILDSDEGKKRPNAALGAALKTSMGVEEATGFLATLPEETKEEAKQEPAPEPTGKSTGFNEAMEATGNPTPGTLEAKTADEEDPSEAMLNALSMATGKPRKSATH